MQNANPITRTSQSRTIAVIGAGTPAGTKLAILFALAGNRLLLSDADQRAVKRSLDAVKALRPDADAEILPCARTSCWEADLIVLAVPVAPRSVILGRIREVSTGKIVVAAGRAARNASALRAMLPNAAIVTSRGTTLSAGRGHADAREIVRSLLQPRTTDFSHTSNIYTHKGTTAMRKTLLLSLLALTLALIVPATSAWKIDNAHSNVKFSVKHMLISEVEGSFKSFNGTFESAKPDFADAAVDFTIDVKSVNTDNEMRDKHLQSDDFFNAEKYPNIRFKSASWKKTGDGKYTLEGDLTIRDVTKRVTFDVSYGGTVKDPWGNTKAGFKAVTVIDRFDYNLKWNKLAEAGAVVGKDVSVTLNLEFAQQ